MRRFLFPLLFLSLMLGLAGASCLAQAVPIGSDEALAWQRHLIPLPRTIAISAKTQLDPFAVAVYAPASPDIVVTQACTELRESMGIPGSTPNPSTPAFTLTLQIGGAESAPLTSLKNSDQAYRILRESGDTGLRIVALSSRGLYYGAKTVQQLLAAYGVADSVQMPLLTVTDWPELKDRGVWGNDSFNLTRWMGDRKLNFQEQIASLSFDGSCTPIGASRTGGYEKIYTEGPFYALEPCLVVLHLEQLTGTGVFTCYPELVAVSGAAGAWCYSQPAAVNVLGKWIADLKSIPYCQDVDVWMAESISTTQGCKCASCKLVNRNVLEARTIVSAWKKAMQTVGPMGLRVLTSEKTRPDHAALVTELSKDPTVKIWHYDSLITYMVSEMPIVDPSFASYAASGHYVGEVPQISASTKCFGPFTSPQFVRYRAQEFKNKNISGVMAYPSPSILYTLMNSDALAEWSWNPDGRSVREYSISYAVRNGYSDPEMFADWCELMGPVSWDVLGSEFPRGILRSNANCGPIATALKNETLPALGQTNGYFPAPWGDIDTIAQFNADVANATKALDLAKKMGIPEFYYESLVTHGYITALRALYELNILIVNNYVAPANRPAAANYFYIYCSGMNQARQALQDWEMAIAGRIYRVPITVDTCATEISQMTTYASQLGCPISTSFTTLPASSIPEAKAKTDGTFVSLGAEVVSSTTNGLYIQEVGGAPAGIKVQTSLSLSLNGRYAILGSLGTTNGERHLNATMVLPILDSLTLRPVGMKTADVGGGAFGLQPAVWEYRKTSSGSELVEAKGSNNIGVLVKIAGRVTAHGTGYFYVDDGCQCDDGSGNTGIRVICGSITKPAMNSWVTVQGPSSTYYDRGRHWRAVVATASSSIRPI